jgi:hypothetical protein
VIVTERLVFLQLQKTGCTHIARLLLHDFDGRELNGKHRPLPPSFDKGARPVVGTVRDPWDWYVSLWTFGCRQRGGPYRRATAERSAWRALRDTGTRRATGFRPGFASRINAAVHEWQRPARTWRRLHGDPDDPMQFREWLKLTLDSGRRFDLYRDYGQSRVSAFAGLLTFLYALLYLRDNSVLFRAHALPDSGALAVHDRRFSVLDTAVRTEALEQGLIDALRHAGHTLTERQRRGIERADHTNSSGRARRLAEYYDAETAELVAHKEAFIVSKYGYRSPLADSQAPP